MKAGKEHRIPLSERSLTLLDLLPRMVNDDGVASDLVFPGQRGDKPLSDMSLTALMRRMKLSAVSTWIQVNLHRLGGRAHRLPLRGP